MTGRELIELIKEKSLEDYEFAVQFRDAGGCYEGSEMIDETTLEIIEEDKMVIM